MLYHPPPLMRGEKRGQVRINVLLVPLAVIFLQILVGSVLGYPSSSVACEFFFSGELLIGLNIVIETNGHFLLVFHITVIKLFSMSLQRYNISGNIEG